jgi:hypothetical protein
VWLGAVWGRRAPCRRSRRRLARRLTTPSCAAVPSSRAAAKPEAKIPGAGGRNAVTSRARAFKEKAALPRLPRERHGDVRARARGPKRATDDNELVIGRSDPPDA